jgi:hypothetical protein
MKEGGAAPHPPSRPSVSEVESNACCEAQASLNPPLATPE